jgi:hypothetical protein
LVKVETRLPLPTTAPLGQVRILVFLEPPDTASVGTGKNGSQSAPVETPLLIPQTAYYGEVIQLSFLLKETMLHTAKIIRVMDYGLWLVKVMVTQLRQVVMVSLGPVVVRLHLLIADGVSHLVKMVLVIA